MWSFSLVVFKIFFLVFDMLHTCLFKKYIYLTWKSELLGSMHLISIIFGKLLIIISSNLYPIPFSFCFLDFQLVYIRPFDTLFLALGESHLLHSFSWCFSLDICLLICLHISWTFFCSYIMSVEVTVECILHFCFCVFVSSISSWLFC